MRIILIVVALIYSLVIQGQIAFVTKVVKDGRAYLAIGIKKDSITNWYTANCFFKEVTVLPDSTKLKLLEELLYYTSDTTKCYNPVINLSNHYETIKKSPTSKEYNLQIDALLLMNYIAFSSDAFKYSPFPLLYDKITGNEIFYTSKELNSIIRIYKTWFNKLKQKGFSNYNYPLFDKRYEWFATKAKQNIFKSYPLWNTFYDCTEFK